MVEPIKISMTNFIDFVGATGTGKLTEIRKIKRMYVAGYNPKFDFWRKLRKAIVVMHQNGELKETLDEVLKELKPKSNKRGPYQQYIKAYKKWLGRKPIEWFDPGKLHWSHRDLTVLVNPELGLKLKGVDYLVKLYFRTKPLSKYRENSVLHLMRKLAVENGIKATPSVLDVSKGSLMEWTVDIQDIDAMLRAEATFFIELWNELT